VTSKEKILQLFEQKNGIVKLNEITKLGVNKYHLSKLIKSGEVERLKHGIYKLVNFNLNEFAEIQAYVPSGIVCLYSAWDYYNLTSYIPHEYHIAIEKKHKIRLPDYPPITLYYWDKSVFELGLSRVQIDNVWMNMYDLEKSVCDAVKFRNKVGKDLLNEILTMYLKRQDKNIEQLIQYAKLLRIERILKMYLEVLL
jgi:predicted transcriptional regulator of viral defense system